MFASIDPENTTTGARREKMEKNQLPLHFHQFFEPRLVMDDATRELIYRMRYDVYCKEFGYEREEDCPGGMETDIYDAVATHCVLVHRASGLLAGAVRLVPPTDKDPRHGFLPIDHFCGHSLEHPSLHPAKMPVDTFCEISRLAVPRVFRRRTGEHETPLGAPEGLVFSEQEIRTFPMIAVALFLAATALVGIHQRPHVFAMMEPRLARMLSRSGLEFTRIGALMDYHGPRAAHYIHHADAVTGMRTELRCLYDVILDSLTTEHGV